MCIRNSALREPYLASVQELHTFHTVLRDPDLTSIQHLYTLETAHLNDSACASERVLCENQTSKVSRNLEYKLGSTRDEILFGFHGDSIATTLAMVIFGYFSKSFWTIVAKIGI